MESQPDQTKIKDYQIHLPPLGEGSFGTVYRATYRSLSDRALKVFRPGAVDIVTMARELEKLSKVAEHNGIITLHDFDLLNDPPYYSMGLHADQSADGEWDTRTLERLCGHVDYQEAWRLIREIADALSYLHRHQIVHCDIKPTNILLTDETPHHTKICDFGQSRGLSAEGFEPVGTPLYASPEQLRSPSDSADGKGFRWDVYSFGVVAYKLLTGDLPRLQSLANAEDDQIDLEATIHEATIEQTMAEGNRLDGENLANMVEAVEEITWPDNFYIPTARKLLIEQCLSLDPAKRPADMRDVWSRIKERDHYRAVRRARRVAALFALLLVFAIWATVAAFIQAGKARLASEEATVSGNQAEDLALIIVNELNNGEITGKGADKLYSIIAEHSETFLDNLPKNHRSETTLRISAQTASMRGRQALERGDLDEALQKYQNAYEIRNELGSRSLAFLANKDLIQIGSIYSLMEDYENAAAYFNRVRVWRFNDFKESDKPSNKQVRQLVESYIKTGETYVKLGDKERVIAMYDQITQELGEEVIQVSEDQILTYQRELMSIIERKGQLQYETEDLNGALDSLTNLINIAGNLNSNSPGELEKARRIELAAMHLSGQIHLDKDDPNEALEIFREEIRKWNEMMRLQPYPELNIGLADAYHKAAECLKDEEDQSQAEFFLDQALSLIANLPTELRNTKENLARSTQFRSELEAVLERDDS